MTLKRTSQQTLRKRLDKQLPIVWSTRALSDLEAIGDFIAIDDPTAASRWIGVLMTAVEMVAAHPRVGRRVPEIGHDAIREIIKRSYRIVYRVQKDRVVVLTVFEGHRSLVGKVD